MAQEIGISSYRYAAIENGNDDPPYWLIDKVRELTGIDPHVLAYSQYYDGSKTPPDVQEHVEGLKKAWEIGLDRMHTNRLLLPTSWW
jgi:hypothetical protein